MDLVLAIVITTTATAIICAILARGILNERTTEMMVDNNKLREQLAAVRVECEAKIANAVAAAQEDTGFLFQELGEAYSELTAVRKDLRYAKERVEREEDIIRRERQARIAAQEKFKAALDGVKTVSAKGDLYVSDDGRMYVLYKYGDEFRILSGRGIAAIVPAEEALLQHDYKPSRTCTYDKIPYDARIRFNGLSYRVFYGTDGAESFDRNEIAWGIDLIIGGVFSGTTAAWSDGNSENLWDRDIEMAKGKIEDLVATFLKSRGLKLKNIVVLSD